MKQLKESILDSDFDVNIEFIDVNMYPWITDNDIWHARYLAESQYEILDYNYAVVEWMLKSRFEDLKKEVDDLRELAQLPAEQNERYRIIYVHQKGINNLISDATNTFRRPLDAGQLIKKRKEILNNLAFVDKLLGDGQFIKIFKKNNKKDKLSYGMISWPGRYNDTLSLSIGIYNEGITDRDREYIKKLCNKIGAEYTNDSDKFLPGGEYADAISKNPNKLEFTPEKLKTIGLVRIEYKK